MTDYWYEQNVLVVEIISEDVWGMHTMFYLSW